MWVPASVRTLAEAGFCLRDLETVLLVGVGHQSLWPRRPGSCLPRQELHSVGRKSLSPPARWESAVS